MPRLQHSPRASGATVLSCARRSGASTSTAPSGDNPGDSTENELAELARSTGEVQYGAFHTLGPRRPRCEITPRWNGPRRLRTVLAVGRRACAAAATQRPYVMSLQ